VDGREVLFPIWHRRRPKIQANGSFATTTPSTKSTFAPGAPPSASLGGHGFNRDKTTASVQPTFAPVALATGTPPARGPEKFRPACSNRHISLLEFAATPSKKGH
jgi:hypothetical protein